MGWNCKPSGGYTIESAEGTENINLYYTMFSVLTSVDNVVGQLCNVFAESGLNPWRWQGDSIATGYSNGYGLYQYTPGNSYINLTGVTGHSPNLSTSTVSGGAPSDARAQIYVFQDNTLGKWVSRCWRPYWNDDNTWSGTPLYPDLWAKRTHILNTYGDGTSLSMADFYTINDIEDACFAFLACFEGPQVPNLTQRLANATAIKNAIQPGPGPTPGSDIMYGGVRDVIRRLILHA